MNVAICVDERDGMMFNHRRQSRDSAVTERVLAFAREHGGTLYVSEYSSPLFDGADDVRIVPVDSVPTADDGIFFAEDIDISGYINEIETLYLFQWGRRYPADVTLPLDPQKLMTLSSTCEFSGTSHEKITLEVYVR